MKLFISSLSCRDAIKTPSRCAPLLLMVSGCMCLIISSQLVESLSNLRIQVNNENLQSPPYLLDAIERAAETAEAGLREPSTNTRSPVPQESNPVATVAVATSADPAVDENGGETRGEASTSAEESAGDTGTLMGAVREETIEDILDLEPESVLKLSPSNLIDSVTSQEGAAGQQQQQQPAAATAETRQGPYDDSSMESSQDKNARLKSQLPVTSSHLKRPITRLTSEAENDSVTADALSPSSGAPLAHTAPPLTITPNQNNEQSSQQQHQSIDSSSGSTAGAKSRVSPSVASDQEPLPASSSAQQALADALEKKTAPLPPDTWEPNQIMAGVTNASHVPATVRRQYGHQTRTRITLGGGYQRNKLPPSLGPSGSGSNDDDDDEQPPRRVLPVATQERPTRGSHGSTSASGGSHLADSSRVIEVPERIVLPASVFKQQTQRPQPQTNASTTASIVRKRDSRCPSNGVTALEHPAACDKYYLCEDGYSSERTCPNGLMYGTRDIVRDHCVHRWQVVCGDKSMPNPISSPGCRWQNGIFNVQGSPKCTPDFYECTDGVFEVKKCTLSGQVYDDKTKSCQFAEQVECAQEALAEFQCPADDQTNTYWPFPRYFLNERALIHCVNDKPEIIRCRDHERVDPENLFCVPIDKASSAAVEAEAGALIEVTARRTPSNPKSKREKGKKVKESVPPVEDDHSNE